MTRNVTINENSPPSDVHSIDTGLMVSYAVASLLLLVAVHVFSIHSDPNPTELVASLALL